MSSRWHICLLLSMLCGLAFNGCSTVDSTKNVSYSGGIDPVTQSGIDQSAAATDDFNRTQQMINQQNEANTQQWVNDQQAAANAQAAAANQ